MEPMQLRLRDDRGVLFDSPFYPHTIACQRKMEMTENPQPCSCGGDALENPKEDTQLKLGG